MKFKKKDSQIYIANFTFFCQVYIYILWNITKLIKKTFPVFADYTPEKEEKRE